MKRLLLLRHAKSARDGALDDKRRPLDARGMDDAPRMGRYLHRHRYLPQLVLCSTATRTVETWELARHELGASPDVRFVDALYLASSATIEGTIRSVDTAISVLLLIGHNPGIEETARTLAREAATKAGRKRAADMRSKFPTGALAVLDFDISDWDEVAAGSGSLVDFARPKDSMPE